MRYGIVSIPTIMIFKDGEPAAASRSVRSPRAHSRASLWASSTRPPRERAASTPSSSFQFPASAPVAAAKSRSSSSGVARSSIRRRASSACS